MAHAKALSGSLLLLLLACGTEPRDNTTADIKADGADGPVTVTAHASVTLSWSSENATSCLVTPGGLSGTTGSVTVEDLTATTTYHLSCSGPGGDAEDTVHIVVPSPPGTEIVFQSDGGGASDDIYVVNADGSGLTRLTDYPDADLDPSWSGDGRQIYFLSSNRNGSGTLDLYAMNADGTDAHLVLADIYGSNGLPQLYAVSPDGTRIAFGATTPLQSPQNVDLFVMNLDGSDRTRIADLPCEFLDSNCHNLEALDWSPDGQRIAYSTHAQGHGFITYGHVAVVNADGTGNQIVTSGTRSTDPAWAPDGQRIVFSSAATNPSYIATPVGLEIINADGTGRTVLLQDGAANTSASWSPDAQSIVFTRFTPGTDYVPPGESELFVVKVDGTGLRRLVDAPGQELAPDWNPAGP
jgi:TolB protein